MARFRLDIEYEGTRYSGWQVQPNARTVQGEIMRALAAAFPGQSADIQGAGRTDAGVHAMVQTAHLELVCGREKPPRPDVIRMRLNDQLPPDVNILRVRNVPSSFHARHDAITRCYLYQVSRRRTAFGKRFVWWVKDPLDVDRMRDAAALFVGLHDFRSFSADPRPEGGSRVKVDEVRIEARGDLILLRVVASHFLWRMVRQMVGVLVEVGRGRLRREHVERFMREASDEPGRYTCPPSGLFLERVFYPGDDVEGELRTLEPFFAVSTPSPGSSDGPAPPPARGSSDGPAPAPARGSSAHHPRSPRLAGTPPRKRPPTRP